MRLPKYRPPTHPGVMLLEEFLKPRRITQVELARRMGVPLQRVNTLVNGKRGVSADTAVLLSEVLDTTPDFWLGLQMDFDLWHALQRRGASHAVTVPSADARRRARTRAVATSRGPGVTRRPTR
jgi:addiction module HigA family antidote